MTFLAFANLADFPVVTIKVEGNGGSCDDFAKYIFTQRDHSCNKLRKCVVTNVVPNSPHCYIDCHCSLQDGLCEIILIVRFISDWNVSSEICEIHSI